MIYTVTFNPAIDYIMHLEEPLLPGMTNRTAGEEYYIGGKGNNVSTILQNLGFENTALGFAAGFTGEAIVKGLQDRGILSDYIFLPEGISRINVKIKGAEDGAKIRETEINGQGPKIPDEALQELFLKLDALTDGDILILSGSIPSSLPDDMYERILERQDGKDILFVVDATKDLLKRVLKYRPFLIKPNNHELGEMFGKELTSEEEIAFYAKELQKSGARNVLVSMAGDGALLVTETGETYRIGVAKGTVVNSVGAGDSMVAGFLAGYLQSGDYVTALKLGTAAGAATAFSEDLAAGDRIREIYATL